MAGRDYTTLALPTMLIQRVDGFVKSNTWGYRNRGEVAAAAIREFLQKHGQDLDAGSDEDKDR